MLADDVLNLGLLLHIKQKEFHSAKDLIESRLATLPDEMLLQAEQRIEPACKQYHRLIELYILTLAGLLDFDSASEFLKHNFVLAAARKNVLMVHLNKMKAMHCAVIQPAKDETTVADDTVESSQTIDSTDKRSDADKQPETIKSVSQPRHDFKQLKRVLQSSHTYIWASFLLFIIVVWMIKKHSNSKLMRSLAAIVYSRVLQTARMGINNSLI